MGIDIGFTDKSLGQSKHARCAPQRRNAFAVYSPIPDANDHLAPYRETEAYVNVARLRSDQPNVYRVIASELRPAQNPDLWHWNEAWFGHIYKDRKMRHRLKPYIEQKASERVLLKKMPPELREALLASAGQEDVLNSWYAIDYDKRQEICKPCPVRPLDETNCYLRFSNYPGMQLFKEGLLLTVGFAGTLDQESLKDAWFSFPHLDRKNGELPRDKLQKLYDMCAGTEIRKGAEAMFNMVAETLAKVVPEGLDMDVRTLDTHYMPFADEFASKFIYRDMPYSTNEARDLLPYLETFKEVADWAVWDTDGKPARARIINFQERIGTLVTALKLADKFELETYVSY